MKGLGLILLGVFLVIVGQRVPQALLSRIFPNDYVYRLSVSVTVDGQTFTGETIAACRAVSDGMPDWLRLPQIGGPWKYREWAVALDVELPGKGFLQLPTTSWCGPTSFRPDSIWKRILMITPSEGPALRDDKIQVQARYGVTALLFDDTAEPRSAIGIQTLGAAEKLGIRISRMSISPATWQQVEDHWKRRPGSPWLAPVTAKCISSDPMPRDCFGGPVVSYHALRYALSDVMRIPEFANWANTSGKTQAVAPLGWRAIRSARLDTRINYRLKPDVANGRWQMTNVANDELRYWTIGDALPADRNAPIICLSDNQCHQVDLDRQLLVDWTAGEVFALRDLTQVTHIFYVRGP